MIRVVKAAGIALLAAAPLAILATAHGQTKEEWRATEKEELKQPTPQVVEPEYQGVTPGKGNPLPKVEELKDKEENWVTWPGFQPLEQGTRIFVQATRPLEFERLDGRKKLTLIFKGCRIFLRNNKNPLVTEHFAGTPVSRAFLKNTGRKKDLQIELVIQLKAETTATVSQYTDPDGYHYLLIDFPAGTFPVPQTEPNPLEEEEPGLKIRS